ncbi:craniofacial development protein 2 [Ditylenchus destructor]|uniref:Craniofacial development protein 2 n=1 Tax=Ditylenchus destructor TaxID=166010 RepID=A0AAD4QTR1_9BILA|nr:craniofacial development protein 2 [Ditylenchus destructor]
MLRAEPAEGKIRGGLHPNNPRATAAKTTPPKRVAQNKLRIATLNLGNTGLGGTDKEARQNEVMTGLEPLKWDVLGLGDIYMDKQRRPKQKLRCRDTRRRTRRQNWRSGIHHPAANQEICEGCADNLTQDRRETYIGTHDADARNESGEKLAAFAQSNHHHVSNTFFQKPLRKRWTWKSNLPTTANSEIDYVLCNRRKLITNIEHIDRLAVRSDHRMVRATIRIKFDRKEHKKRDPRGETDANKLKTKSSTQQSSAQCFTDAKQGWEL